MQDRETALKEQENAREWQAIAYGDHPATWAALAYYRERGWPVDANTFPERDRCENRIFAFKAGYAAALASPLSAPPQKPTGASPQAETRRDCTCLGTCRGAEGLGPRWKCALETPAPVSPVEPTGASWTTTNRPILNDHPLGLTLWPSVKPTGASLRTEVDAARAAEATEATQYQQFKECLASALCVENEHGPVTEQSIVEAADATLNQLFDFSARLAAVEVERDRLRAAIEQVNRLLDCQCFGHSRCSHCKIERILSTALSGEGTAKP